MTEEKQKPLFRVHCARIIGRDRNGKEQLGRFCQIGAVWDVSEGKKWLPMPLDITPQELNSREAVLFLQPVEADNQGGFK